MKNKTEKWIWSKILIPELKIPIMKDMDLNLGNIELCTPSLFPLVDYHIYKPTGRTQNEEYEYEYKGSTKI